MVQCNDSDVSVVMQFLPEDDSIQVHQLRVCAWPQLPISYYWYGGKHHSSGKTPSWIDKLLSEGSSDDDDKEQQADVGGARGDPGELNKEYSDEEAKVDVKEELESPG